MKKLRWIIIIIVLIISSAIGKAIRQSHKEQRSITKAIIQSHKEQHSFSNPFPQTSPLHEPYKEFIEKALQSRNFGNISENVSSEDHAFAIGVTSSQKGLRRLDDISLENRMRLVGMLLEKVDIETCAVMVRGGNLPQYQEFQHKFQQQFLSSLEQLGPVIANEWFDLTIKAIVAEARGDPPPVTIDKQKIITSINNLLRRLSQADSNKLRNILTNLNSSNKEDVCWAGKTLYREALKMDVANKSVLARAFVPE